ncbi:MAG TPA: glycosyltransferase family 2 protein [Candidatus Helicobacter avicola]|nr:glycosyltransferase family 2 protein [Candidatus Helicobacter avicola]
MSNPHKIIGIVVPIYNTAKYLERCLDSILAQSYTHFYVALVNDGSSDGSLEIAKSYVARDSRFMLFDKPNGGQSSARNVGIEYFSGKYTQLQTKVIESITTSDITESKQSQDSKKGNVCSRSGAVRGFTSNPDSNLLKNKIEMDSINPQTFAFGGGQITHYRDSLY